MTTFDKKWEIAQKRAQERIKTDESLKILQKKYADYVGRLRKTESSINLRISQIVQEELKKEFEQEKSKT